MLSKELKEVKEKVEQLAAAGNQHAKILVGILEKSDPGMTAIFLENIAPFINITSHLERGYDTPGFIQEAMRRKNGKN